MKTLIRKDGGLHSFAIVRTMSTYRLVAPTLLAILALASVAPLETHAASSKSSSLEISGWIPYWRTEAGTKDAKAHLANLTEVNPFGYTVKSDGTLNDALKVQGKDWQSLFKAAKAKKVRVVPTVMWSDTNAIHTVLSDSSKRASHIAGIVKMVQDNDFDGVDIDYEGKKADTRIYYSAFLKELSEALGDKLVMCTIEARMPLDSRYVGTPPPGIEYANDLKEINTYCDRVRIMTYDQQTADVKLNKIAREAKEIYAPIADTKWVESVITYMAQDIDKKKMVIGIATYGHIYQIMPNSDGSGYGYTRLEAFNPRYATDLAKTYRITPIRNRAGELSFSYVPKDQPAGLPTQKALAALAPKGTASANLAAAGALVLAQTKGTQAPIQYLTWSDSGAIGAKVALAKKLGVKGVAVFKIDGGSDSKMWRVLKK